MNKLQAQDFIDDAQHLQCEPEAIMAVARAESGFHGGFYKDGSIVILYEPHVFHRRTCGQYGTSHPHLSYQKWDPKKYGSTASIIRRFNEACTLDNEAAHWSTSWGLFQIMGFHHATLGFHTAVDMAEFAKKGENEHLWLFSQFIKANPVMHKALQDKDWTTFARLYNGAGYAQNRYDAKMAQFYAEIKRKGF